MIMILTMIISSVILIFNKYCLILKIKHSGTFKKQQMCNEGSIAYAFFSILHKQAFFLCF